MNENETWDFSQIQKSEFKISHNEYKISKDLIKYKIKPPVLKTNKLKEIYGGCLFYVLRKIKTKLEQCFTFRHK